MQYAAGLDGLRTLAVIAVLMFHSADKTGPLYGGFLGVDVFFVLSGYLITGILLNEFAANSRIDYKQFMHRRLLRLMPALVFFLVIYVIFAPLIWTKFHFLTHFRDAFYAITYLADFDYALNDLPKILRHMWSLSIEMHFYMVWPLIIPFIIRSRHPIKIMIGLYAIASIWRCIEFYDVARWYGPYARFDTRLSGLLLGSLLSVWIASKPKIPNIPFVIILLAIITLAVSMHFHDFKTLPPMIWGMPIAELCTAILIVAIVHNQNENIITRFLSSKYMVKLGILSYGIYLWHFPMTMYLRKEYDFGFTFACTLVFSIIMAKISYETVELWGRQIQKKSKQNSLPAAQTIGA